MLFRRGHSLSSLPSRLGDTTNFGVATNQHGCGRERNPLITKTDALFTVKPGTQITSFSFDLGSLDDFNKLTFEHNGVAVAGGVFTGMI